MIPFFVADRPMSLRILKGLNLKDYPGVKIGIMAHANTSDNFQKAFRDYPCEDLKRCDAIGAKPCPYKTERGRNNCKHRQLILERTVKMCDSGVFTREGAMLSYEELFATYSRMNVEYGIMIDVLHDANATLKSALEAKKAYKPYENKFKLIVVAQGKTEEEYLDCYGKLKFYGFENIAIGGLLRRNQNTVRYVKVGNEELLFSILEKIKDKYSPYWLFALGCLNPKRVERLNELNVWADYKGWIFQYKKRNQTLDSYLKQLVDSNCVNELSDSKLNNQFSKLENTINERKNYADLHKELLNKLHKGKLSFRTAMLEIYKVLKTKKSEEKTATFHKLTTRGLLSQKEKQFVAEVLYSLEGQQSEKSKLILENINENCKLNKEIKETEDRLNKINNSLAEHIKLLTNDKPSLSEGKIKLCKQISNLISISEHIHRIEQVRTKISQVILEPLSSKN